MVAKRGVSGKGREATKNRNGIVVCLILCLYQVYLSMPGTRYALLFFRFFFLNAAEVLDRSAKKN